MHTKESLIKKWNGDIASYKKAVNSGELTSSQKEMARNHMSAISDCLTDLKKLNGDTEKRESKSVCRNCDELTESIPMGNMCAECYCEK